MLTVASQHSRKWKDGPADAQPITLQPLGLGALADKKVFTMGSCFALEIRHALRNQGIDAFPNYAGIPVDASRYRIAKLPARDNINHYSIASICQEVERCADGRNYGPESFWNLADDDALRRLKRFARQLFSEEARAVQFADPFRKQVFGATLDDLGNASGLVFDTIREGLGAADICVFTLGMTETWRDRSTGLTICNGYGGAVDEAKCAFHPLSYADVLDCLARTVAAVRAVNPGAEIVFSLSPVPLARTFRNMSVLQANAESKAIQRAALVEFIAADASGKVHYFPSYEFVTSQDGFRPEGDGRHVRDEIVEQIVATFFKWWN